MLVSLRGAKAKAREDDAKKLALGLLDLAWGGRGGAETFLTLRGRARFGLSSIHFLRSFTRLSDQTCEHVLFMPCRAAIVIFAWWFIFRSYEHSGSGIRRPLP